MSNTSDVAFNVVGTFLILVVIFAFGLYLYTEGKDNIKRKYCEYYNQEYIRIDKCDYCMSNDNNFIKIEWLNKNK